MSGPMRALFVVLVLGAVAFAGFTAKCGSFQSVEYRTQSTSSSLKTASRSFSGLRVAGVDVVRSYTSTLGSTYYWTHRAPANETIVYGGFLKPVETKSEVPTHNYGKNINVYSPQFRAAYLTTAGNASGIALKGVQTVDRGVDVSKTRIGSIFYGGKLPNQRPYSTWAIDNINNPNQEGGLWRNENSACTQSEGFTVDLHCKNPFTPLTCTSNEVISNLAAFYWSTDRPRGIPASRRFNCSKTIDYTAPITAVEFNVYSDLKNGDEFYMVDAKGKKITTKTGRRYNTYTIVKKRFPITVTYITGRNPGAGYFAVGAVVDIPSTATQRVQPSLNVSKTSPTGIRVCVNLPVFFPDWKDAAKCCEPGQWTSACVVANMAMVDFIGNSLNPFLTLTDTFGKRSLTSEEFENFEDNEEIVNLGSGLKQISDADNELVAPSMANLARDFENFNAFAESLESESIDLNDDSDAAITEEPLEF